MGKIKVKETVTSGEYGDYKLIFGYDGSDWRPILIDSGGRIISLEYFGGQPYNKNVTVADDSKHAFEASTKKIRDIVIHNTHATQSIIIGKDQADVGTMRTADFELEAGLSVGFTKVNLALLYYVNKANGETPTFETIGVEE